MKLYRGEFQDYHPKFAADSLAACREQPGPIAVDAPNIEYTTEDDKAIDEYHRQFGELGSPVCVSHTDYIL
jgi:alcohol oxidase